MELPYGGVPNLASDTGRGLQPASVLRRIEHYGGQTKFYLPELTCVPLLPKLVP
jgi:hypothetical protein